jgi:hypothetical protein
MGPAGFFEVTAADAIVNEHDVRVGLLDGKAAKMVEPFSGWTILGWLPDLTA